MPRLEDEPQVALTESELPMYFTEPNQLLDLLTLLEESNLFLIQQCQVCAAPPRYSAARRCCALLCRDALPVLRVCCAGV
jgi:hypothetical protein